MASSLSRYDSGRLLATRRAVDMSWLPISLYRWRRSLAVWTSESQEIRDLLELVHHPLSLQSAKGDVLVASQDNMDSRTEGGQMSFKLGVRAPPSNWVQTNNYTLLNFLPKFLFIQFKQIANLYFLILAFIQLLPGLSPFGKQATLVPLMFIIGCSAVREIYEDVLHVGQIIKVVNGEQLAADCLLLATSESGSVAYVETANLDGESNLKEFWKSGVKIVYDTPNRKIYEFQGYMIGNSPLLQQAPESNSKSTETPLEFGIQISNVCRYGDENWATNPTVHHGSAVSVDFSLIIVRTATEYVLLANAQVVLRGARLKNTDNIYAIVLYTGHDTKLFMNSIKRVMKSGFIPISLYVTLEMVQIIQGMFIHHDEKMIDENDRVPDVKMVSLNSELGNVKYVLSDKTGTLTQNCMRFRMCSIGGVKYANRKRRRERKFSPNKLISNIVSNEMKYSVLEFTTPKYPLLATDGSFPKLLCEVTAPVKYSVIRVVAADLCNLVCRLHGARKLAPVPDNPQENLHILSLQLLQDDGNAVEKSPVFVLDENALLNFASDAGFIFKKRSGGKIIVNMMGAKLEFELAAILEFDSDRKRMSVIVKEMGGKYKLYIKGAVTSFEIELTNFNTVELNCILKQLQDYKIFDRLKNVSEKELKRTAGHLRQFAIGGYRTLCFAMKTIDDAIFAEWYQRYNETIADISNRRQKLAELAEEIEKDLTLIGVSAIDDRLQKDVPQTVARLLSAGIRVWVLTGDKLETAVNIGNSCRLLSARAPMMVLSSTNSAGAKEELSKWNGEKLLHNLSETVLFQVALF
uniref:PhoLip_ATPase_N domain-containing protein n=1 Tax=Angiostrongylus cantonensis TaxID=6313 RepID=A0A158P9J8_ANGCA